jgi:hypothetical protein
MVTTKQREQPPESGTARCRHQPACPPSTGPGRLAAVVIAAHPEQGWSLLCNGVITFDDTGAIAAGHTIPPQRGRSSPRRVSSSNARAALHGHAHKRGGRSCTHSSVST